MTNRAMEDLEADIAGFPERASGEEFYEFMINQAGRWIERDPEGLVGALRAWLALRAEPRTMLAVEIAARFRLTELRPEIEWLPADVRAGQAFRSHSVRPIEKALANIDG